MSEFEKLILDYDNFEFDYDSYSYDDAFIDREEGRENARNALADADFRVEIIDRLQEIADEDDEYHDQALELIARIKKLS